MKARWVMFAFVVVFLGACGSDSVSPQNAPVADESEDGPETEAPSPGEGEEGSKGSSPDGTSAEVTAKVIDTAFKPNELTVKVGTTVTWRQVGDQPHSVTAANGEFDSSPKCSPLKSEVCDFEGDTYSFTFEKAGTYEYYCRIHGLSTGRGMSATVTVED